MVLSLHDLSVRFGVGCWQDGHVEEKQGKGVFWLRRDYRGGGVFSFFPLFDLDPIVPCLWTSNKEKKKNKGLYGQ